MGDVIVRESFKRSPKFDKLNWFEEALAIRLMTLADDDGMVDGRPLVVKNMAYPTKTSINTKAVDSAMSKLVKVGILSPASDENNSIPYLKFSEEFFEPKPKTTTTNSSSSSSKYIPDNKYLSSGVSHNRYEEERNYTVQRNTRTKDIPDTEGNPYGTNDGVSTNIGGEDEQGIQDVCRYISNALLIVTPGQVEDVRKWIEDFPDELIKMAVDIACDAGKPRWNYVKGILRRWENDGLTTLAAVKEHIAEQDAKKKRKQAAKEDDYSDPDDLSWW